MKIKYTKNPHQKSFHEDVTSKIPLLTSGFGAGKSYALVMKLIQLSYLNRPFDGGLVCPSIADYKKDMLPLFLEILNENEIQYEYHQTDKWFQFPWSKGKLQAVSAENKIRGPNWAYAGINEVGLISYERFKEVLGRVRLKGSKCPQIPCVGTPEGKSNWVYDHFVVNPRKGTRIIYGDTRHNFAIAEDYIQSLKDNYDSIMLQAYLEGRFVNMVGSLFYYAFSRERNLDNNIKRNESLLNHIGLDFNVDHMVANIWNIIPGPRGDSAHCFDEIHLKDSNTEKLCHALKARGYMPNNSVLYPDPSGNSRRTSGFADIQILKNNGYEMIKFRAKAAAHRDRQLCVNSLLDKGLVKINPNSCPILLRDIEGVEQNVGDFSKMKDNLELTHASDAMDYFLDINFPLAGKKPIQMFER